MRIAYLITRMSEWGGAQVHVRDLAMRLHAQGNDIHVIAGDEGVISSTLRQAGITVHIVPEIKRTISIKNDTIAIIKLHKLLRALQPDLLSCHSSKAGVLGRIAATTAGVPVVFTAHGYAFTDTSSRLKTAFYTALEAAMRACSDYVITVSDYDRLNARRAHLVPASRIKTIHNGMADMPAKLHSPHDGPVRLIMVARFAAQKDHTVLLQALAQLRDLDWTLALVGGGNAEAAFAQTHLLGLQDRVSILGQRADVIDLLNEADIFVLTTHWEGFPRSIIEAMRAGLPVLATDVAGVPEAVTEGVTGFLVPPRDAAAVAAKLRILIEQPDLRLKMGTAGRARFAAEFTFDHMFKKTVDVYQTVTGMTISA